MPSLIHLNRCMSTLEPACINSCSEVQIWLETGASDLVGSVPLSNWEKEWPGWKTIHNELTTYVGKEPADAFLLGNGSAYDD